MKVLTGRNVTLLAAAVGALATSWAGTTATPILAANSAPAAVSTDWATNQRLVDLAQAVTGMAGDAFAGVEVNQQSGVVTLSLAGGAAARSNVAEQVSAQYPAAAIEFQQAAYPLSVLDKDSEELGRAAKQWLARGVDIRHLVPTLDGHLEVGVASDLTAAQRAFDAAVGEGVVQVVADTSGFENLSQRASDSSPWNGGDFLYNTGHGNCSAGIPVHGLTNPNHPRYVLTAAHCFSADGSTGTNVRNGWISDADGSLHGSQTLIGAVAYSDTGGTGYSDDSALISADSSDLDFIGDSNDTYTNIQESSIGNVDGSQACASGAFEGQRCSIVIDHTNETRCVGGVCRYGLSSGLRSDGGYEGGTGDSGGPVYAYDPNNGKLEPLGMIDVGQPGTETTCPSGSPNHSYRTCYTRIWWVGMKVIETHWNIAANTN